MLINPLTTRASAYGAPRASVGPGFVPRSAVEPMDAFRPSPVPMFVVSALMRQAIAPVTVPLAGTPLHMRIDDLRWPRSARREVEAHMQDRGLRKDEPVANLIRRELAVAKGADSRVTSADMLSAVARSERAQRLVPVPQNDLFGFTRLTDSKFSLTDGLVDNLEALGADPKLVEGLDKALGGEGASAQLNMDARTADFLTRTLSTLKVPTQEAMGGAGAFCANLAACQPNVRAAFWALGGLPPKVAQGMHPGVTVLDDQGRQRPASQAVDLSQADRINYIAEYRGEVAGRLILSSPGNQEIGFGSATDDVLKSTIGDKRLFFFAGLHYLTRGDLSKADEVARDLGAMKSFNPGCMFHLQYVNPKDPANEKAVLDKMAPHVDSMSLNSVELPSLLERIRPGYDGVPSTSDRDVLETPGNMLDNAYRLRETMGLSRVHVHGKFGDLVIARTPKDKERTVLALVKARQLAAMKATNVSGQVAGRAEMWPMLPLVEGACLASVQRFADSVKEKFNLTEDQRAQVARDWHYDDGQGNTVFFVPSRGIHDRTGGTVSLGDTIDASALIYSME